MRSAGRQPATLASASDQPALAALLFGFAAALAGCGGGGAGAGPPVAPANAAPTADAGPDQAATEGATVYLIGSGEDSDGTVTSYRWQQIGGTEVELDGPDAATTQFAAPAHVNGASDLVFRLTVTDNRGSTGSDEVTVTVSPPAEDPFAHWNGLDPEPWWRESAPYSCAQAQNPETPWPEAGLIDLGGSDPLSLIRWYGNGSYLRYGYMGFSGCTRMDKYPDSFHRDPPADPTYYSLGHLDIRVDIARVPADATGWFMDDGARVGFSMVEAVALLNTYVATWYRRVSEDRLRIVFHAGNEFDVEGDGSPAAMENQQFRLAGACPESCRHGAPGGLNRILLTDVAADTGGRAYNGWAAFGLVSLRDENMETIVHEMGHGWMAWPHSFAEVPWRPAAGRELQPPNPYSNFHDIMSGLDVAPIPGWDYDMPSTLAINHYAAGWIPPDEVALHLTENATYTLSQPRRDGYQFLVVHSGRRYAFTTLEVLEERSARFRSDAPVVFDPAAPFGFRARRYDGVLVSRYDQTTGTGTSARTGPALYRSDNPRFLTDVGRGRDDYSLIPDGGTRDIGGGVRVTVARNRDGSYEVTVSGGKTAEFETWCNRIWFADDDYEYDTGCYLDEAEWE